MVAAAAAPAPPSWKAPPGNFARSLAQGGFAITSGLALGIDGAAHEGALEVGGATVAVLGTGLRRLYPRRHEAGLARRIVEGGGALVSGTAALGSPPLPANLPPRRNRIISGLSLVCWWSRQVHQRLADHRAAGSGTGSRACAIPGSIHHPGARGRHQLIRDGAVAGGKRRARAQHYAAGRSGASRRGTTPAHPLLALLRLHQRRPGRRQQHDAARRAGDARRFGELAGRFFPRPAPGIHQLRLKPYTSRTLSAG
ncbi:DNA-processing protein DprA [Pseudomonas aeruginosa]